MSFLTRETLNRIANEKAKKEKRETEELEAKKDNSDSREKIHNIFFEIDNPSNSN